MTNRIFIYLSLLTALCFSSGCNNIEPGTTVSSTGQTIKLAVAEARIASSPGYYEAVGTVRAETTSTISGKLMGTVKAVNVREGDAITKGQALIVIDERQVTAQLQQAKAALEEASRSESAAVSSRDAAQAGAELAQAAYKRYLKLISDNAVSKQEFDEIEIRSRQADAALKQAEATVGAAKQKIKQAEAAVAAAEVSRKDADITAPYDGIVTARMIEPGDLAAPGTPFLTIEKTGDVEVDAIIPEDYIHAITLNQELDVIIPSLQDQALKGTVKRLDPSADPQSHSFIVKIGLPIHSGIHSGLFARINIPLAGNNMLLIPSSALVLQGQLTGIFILDENSIARFRIIRTGRKTKESIEVISGLKNGSIYVVSPPKELKDGAKVEASS